MIGGYGYEVRQREGCAMRPTYCSPTGSSISHTRATDYTMRWSCPLPWWNQVMSNMCRNIEGGNLLALRIHLPSLLPRMHTLYTLQSTVSHCVAKVDSHTASIFSFDRSIFGRDPSIASLHRAYHHTPRLAEGIPSEQIIYVAFTAHRHYGRRRQSTGAPAPKRCAQLACQHGRLLHRRATPSTHRRASTRKGRQSQR